MIEVNNEEQLRAAIAHAHGSTGTDEGTADTEIALGQSILLNGPLILPAGVTLTASGRQPRILGFSHGDGIGLTANNTVKNIAIQTAADARAIFIQPTTATDLGTLTLKNLRVTGMVQLTTRTPAQTVQIVADRVDVVFADTRNYTETQLKYGVTVEQGAFTVHNFSASEDSLITATLTDISVGRLEAPVLGSGIFIAGFGDKGGKVEVSTLTTGEVHSHGMIPGGQPNLITGGIFILSGAHATEIVSKEVVYTYGVNDMTLDVWGEVDSWITEKAVRSFGTSGIGFVNFGTVHHFEAKEPIETFGSGARAFNQYDGTIDEATFAGLITHGDGSIGMQVSRPVGSISITGDIETHGGIGDSLVKGVIMELEAMALSIQADGHIQKLTVGGNLITHGDGVTTVRVDGGTADTTTIGGEIQALGEGATTLLEENGGSLNL